MYDSNTLAQRLSQASVGQMDRVFIEHGLTGEATTYAAFFANAERLAAALVTSFVTPGARVAAETTKTIAMLELYPCPPRSESFTSALFWQARCCCR